MMKKGELSNMCEVLDRAEARGLAEGFKEGRVIAYYDAGYSVEQIAEKIEISKEKVQEIPFPLFPFYCITKAADVLSTAFATKEELSIYMNSILNISHYIVTFVTYFIFCVSI